MRILNSVPSLAAGLAVCVATSSLSAQQPPATRGKGLTDDIHVAKTRDDLAEFLGSNAVNFYIPIFRFLRRIKKRITNSTAIEHRPAACGTHIFSKVDNDLRQFAHLNDFAIDRSRIKKADVDEGEERTRNIER